MSFKEKKLRKIDIRRQELRELSEQAKELKELAIIEAEREGDQNKILWLSMMGVNDAIHYFIYKSVKCKSFNNWKKEGYTVKKGSKAILFWGQPIDADKTDKKTGEIEEFEFFPVAFVFKRSDVTKNELITTPYPLFYLLLKR